MKIFAETHSTVQNTKNRMSEMTKKRQACGLKGTYKDSRPLLKILYNYQNWTISPLQNICLQQTIASLKQSRQTSSIHNASFTANAHRRRKWLYHIHTLHLLQSYRQDPDNATKMKQQIPNEIYSANESNTANLSSLNHAAAPDSPLYHAPAPDTGRDLSPHHARSSDVSRPVGHAPAPDTERDLSEFTSSI